MARVRTRVTASVVMPDLLAIFFASSIRVIVVCFFLFMIRLIGLIGPICVAAGSGYFLGGCGGVSAARSLKQIEKKEILFSN